MEEPRRSLDEYGPGEMAIPEWRLLQKVGGDWAKGLGGNPGQFFNKITDELADELNIVVVDILTGRAKWGIEISDAGPVCASMDAKSMRSIYYAGIDDEEGVGDCSKCPDKADAPWALEATERRQKCCLNYTILAIDLDHGYMPVMIRAHGTSALASRQLITQLKMNRALRGEYYRARVNVKCQEKNTPFGTTYVIHPKIVELITDESKTKELKAESNRLLGAPIPLPEGRPDDLESVPLGFTPEGTPFYSEEERVKLMTPADEFAERIETLRQATEAADQAAAEAAAALAEEKEIAQRIAAAPAPAAEPAPPEPEPAPPAPETEEKKETPERKLDLDF